MKKYNKKIYIFRENGKKFLVDINSGNFFEINNVTYDIMKLIDKKNKNEMVETLKSKYEKSDILSAIKEIEKLKNKRFLFADNKRYIKRLEKLQKIDVPLSSLVLNIINECNLKCKYCWNLGGKYDGAYRVNRMGEETAYKAIDILVKGSKGKEHLEVEFYGGEPLLNFDLMKKTIEYCKEQEVKHNKKLSFKFDFATNGTLLTQEIAEYLFQNNTEIIISIDGPPEIHDKLRVYPNGKDTFNQIIKNFQSLPKQIKDSIIARVTFTPLYPDVVKIAKYLNGIGFKNLQIVPSTNACFNMDKYRKKFLL